MEKREFTFRVKRNARGDIAEGFRDYRVELEPRMTVLDGLELIRRTQDETLLYRHSCHHGSCGTCGCNVNGEKRLACLSTLNELETEEITLEPLAAFELIGDLAVDPTSLFAEYHEDRDYLRPSEVNAEATVPEEIDGYERFENCIDCGLCVSACPVTKNFTGPAALAALNREIEKHPEREDELLDIAAQDRGAPACRRALNCSRVCPAGVAPAKHIAILRRKIEKRS
jgi:succinate dehydrogenase / fumarate reductase iron-sulfur subunit